MKKEIAGEKRRLWVDVNRNSRLQMFFKIGVLKHFANFSVWKHLCWSPFLIKLRALRTPNKSFSCEIFKNTFFIEHLSSSYCLCFNDIVIKVNESRYIALFVVSRSIEKLLSIDLVNIYLFDVLFSIGQYFCFLYIFYNRCCSLYRDLLPLWLMFWPIKKISEITKYFQTWLFKP